MQRAYQLPEGTLPQEFESTNCADCQRYMTCAVAADVVAAALDGAREPPASARRLSFPRSYPSGLPYLACPEKVLLPSWAARIPPRLRPGTRELSTKEEL